MIEMNSLQGHTEDNVYPIKQEYDHDEKSSPGPVGPGQWLMSRILRPRRNRCLIMLVSVLLIITVVYVVDRVYMSRQNMDAFLEPFERESGIVENDVQNDEMQQSKEKDENETETEHMTENKFGGSNNPYDSKINNVVGNNSPKHSGNCIDDPDFMFIKIPGKNCDWVSQNSRKVCNMLYKGQLVRDFCKVACNNCINKGEKEDTKNIINNIGCDDQAENCDDNTNTSIDDSLEDEENKTSPGQDRGDGNNDDKDQQPTIIDDNDVFCEDLSQYQKWYEAKVTKADGVKFRIVKEYKHDENAFT